jgi:hypothetical protein
VFATLLRSAEYHPRVGGRFVQKYRTLQGTVQRWIELCVFDEGLA